MVQEFLEKVLLSLSVPEPEFHLFMRQKTLIFLEYDLIVEC